MVIKGPHAGVAGGYLWRLNPQAESSRIFGVFPRAVRPPVNRSGRVWPRSRPTRCRGHDAATRSAQKPSWHMWLRAQPARTPLGLSICARAADRRSAASEWAVGVPCRGTAKSTTLSSRKIGMAHGLRVAWPFARVAKGWWGVGSARGLAPPGGFGGRRAIATKQAKSMAPRVVPPRTHELANRSWWRAPS